MPTREDMVDLVQAHAALEDPTEIAIWIRQEDREAWLVEVIPSMNPDEHPEHPVMFTPGKSFRYALNLIAGNRQDIERALRNDLGLASAVARGEVLHGAEVGQELVALAQDIATHANNRAS